jgi:adenine-specific DNA-methyltransferase
MNKFDELVAKLEELFELDKVDLDFGIHRIIKQKHVQIQEYLHKRLPEKVENVLGELIQNASQVKRDEMRRKCEKALGFEAFEYGGKLSKIYVNTPLGKQYTKILKQAGEAADAKRNETEVYSHLYEFFSRYYDNADFLSLRRTGNKHKYSVPYNGEEVLLHWANKDQYYIKSSETLNDYTFRLEENNRKLRVKFKLTNMDAIQNNNKAARAFVIDEEKEIEENADAIVIPFHFKEFPRKPTEKQMIENLVTVLEAKLPQVWKERLWEEDSTFTGKDSRTVLRKHLANYTKKNTSDFFIHKNLGEFLRNELDFYIKNEVMYLDDVDDMPDEYLEKVIRKIKAIRIIAKDLIAFLAQFEDFQKKLWLKKKFVIETNYCITLDRIAQELYPQIIANDRQCEEWVKLFAIDEIQAEIGQPGYSSPLSMEFLKANPYLVLDTAFFDDDFKYSVLAGIDDFDAQCDGLMIHSENFQALNLIVERYKRQIKATYIDPPYNTVHSEIIYKNQYKHSSWMSLIANVARVTPAFWPKTFSFGLSIDDYEFVNLAALLDDLFPNLERSVIVVNHHPQGAGGRLSRTHEYLILCSPANAPLFLGKPKDDYQEARNFMRSGTAENNFRSGRWKSFYALLLDSSTNIIADVEHPVPLGEEYPTSDTPEGYQRIYPINSKGEERVWRSSYITGKKKSQKGELNVSERGTVYQTIDHNGKRETLFSNWTDSKFNAGIHGSSVISDLGLGGAFDYPKSIFTVETALWAQTYGDRYATVLDYFAGSGTTGHAVVNLNRCDGGKRKYILVEMGNYFDAATKPRIQKIIYSDTWSAEKPTTRNTGISHCFKYIRLESYEDTLNNLTMEDRKADLLGLKPDVQEEYLLNYMLDMETRGSLLNIDYFENPFDCTLKIYNRKTGEAEPIRIDLPETFNYLLGLTVCKIRKKNDFLFIEGKNPAGEKVLVIWRNVKEKDNTALEEFVTKTLRIDPADTEYKAIYINGDTTLNDPHQKIMLTEKIFHNLMFDQEGV